jgi:hypothetical protein
MHPHVFTQSDEPRPTPWLDDFAGLSRRQALRALLEAHEATQTPAPSWWEQLRAWLTSWWAR